MRSITLFLGLALAPTSIFAATDISGIQLGQSFPAVKELVKKVNPAYELNDIKWSDGKLGGLNATVKRKGYVVDQFVVLQNKAGKVWFVGRAQQLEKGARVKPDVLLDSLKEKYGPYTELSTGSGGPSWNFDRNGKLYQGPTTQGPCYGGLGTGSIMPLGQNVMGVNISPPRDFTQKCGMEITSGMATDLTDGMVNSFGVRLIDSKSMYDELNGQAVTEETKRNQQLQNEKAKNVKPQL